MTDMPKRIGVESVFGGFPDFKDFTIERCYAARYTADTIRRLEP